MTTCVVTDCDKAPASAGLCWGHYMRKQRYGDPLGGIVTQEQRFWAKVDKTDECWLWKATIDSCGYGRIQWNGKLEGAHRVGWSLHHGAMPAPGQDLDHLCRVRNCVRFDHLEPVSHHENVLRGSGYSARNAVKTHCPMNHPYDEANTRITKGGGRACRACATPAGRAATKARQASLPPESRHHLSRRGGLPGGLPGSTLEA